MSGHTEGRVSLMDFIDWRKSPDKKKIVSEDEKPRENRYRGKAYQSYIDQQIREAQERGAFDNLAGTGKPLQLQDDHESGDKALGYRLLKNNGYVPFEIELLKEVQRDHEMAETKLKRLVLRRESWLKRSSLLASDKIAFNQEIEEAAATYEKDLRALNSKILTLNLSTPTTMHQPLLQIEKKMQEFYEACPLFIF
jgi:DnaJ homolog subfamily C member 28